MNMNMSGRGASSSAGGGSVQSPLNAHLFQTAFSAQSPESPFGDIKKTLDVIGKFTGLIAGISNIERSSFIATPPVPNALINTARQSAISQPVKTF